MQMRWIRGTNDITPACGPSMRNAGFIARPSVTLRAVAALALCAFLASCGGGGGSGQTAGASTGSGITNTSDINVSLLAQQPGAPTATGVTATDGFNWFNFRRQQAGLTAVTRNAQVAQAAQAHSTYQKLNDTITHDEIQGNPGFTGVALADRLSAAGYTFQSPSYAYGEVISATGDTSGFAAAEDLVGAIYHRFVILEPMFAQAGSGSDTVTNGYTYFTTDFVVDGLNGGLAHGGFVVYPFPGQTDTPTNFYSDREIPDPVPNQNEVGYPISVHANIDINTAITVQSFTVQPHGGSPLQVRTLVHASDSNTPISAAAIIPLSPLNAKTTYDVHFAGTVDGVAASRDWSFTTQ